MLPEIDYYTQKEEIVDAAILSPRSRDMCKGLHVYWTTRNPISNGKLPEATLYFEMIYCIPIILHT